MKLNPTPPPPTGPTELLLQALPDVRRTAWRRVWKRRSVDGCDVVQEVAVAILSRPERYDPARGPLGAWLWNLAGTAVTKIRRRGRRYESLGDRAEHLFSNTPAPDDDAGPAIANEVAGRVRAAVSNLPPHEREVIELRFGLKEPDVAGMTRKAVAEVLGTSPFKVQTVEVRAIGRLRRALAPALGESSSSAPPDGTQPAHDRVPLPGSAAGDPVEGDGAAGTKAAASSP